MRLGVCVFQGQLRAEGDEVVDIRVGTGVRSRKSCDHLVVRCWYRYRIATLEPVESGLVLGDRSNRAHPKHRDLVEFGSESGFGGSTIAVRFVVAAVAVGSEEAGVGIVGIHHRKNRTMMHRFAVAVGFEAYSGFEGNSKLLVEERRRRRQMALERLLQW